MVFHCRMMHSGCMSDAALRAIPKGRSPRRQVSFDEGLSANVRALLAEREKLQEEIRQLEAALRIYAELVRRLERADGRPVRAA